jgi:hypothetical protein
MALMKGWHGEEGTCDISSAELASPTIACYPAFTGHERLGSMNSNDNSVRNFRVVSSKLE